MCNYNNLRTTTIFGFWLYIMSDCILFATLFATYIVLINNTQYILLQNENIFSLSLVFLETSCLLLSSLTYGAVMINTNKLCIKKVNLWMIITFLLGLSFICIEIYEFNHLIMLGNNPSKNSFFSAFFTLVGTHGLHVIIGLIWIIIMLIHIKLQGLTLINKIRLECLSIFWHFLDIIWICLFTEVYLITML